MLPYTFRKEHPPWYEHSDACLLLDLIDSMRADYNDEIEAQEGNFRSFTGDFHRSKNFGKVSTDFWSRFSQYVTQVLHLVWRDCASSVLV